MGNLTRNFLAAGFRGFFWLGSLNAAGSLVTWVAYLRGAGIGTQVVVSHDSVWCWRGAPLPAPEIQAQLEKVWNPTHFLTRIAPRLREQGVSEAEIETLLVDNPRRFFAGEPLPG